MTGARLKLADLYCCAGGAAKGYHDAGFDVVGYDIKPQPNYPYEFRRRDVLALSPEELAEEFDAFHASPICQGHTALRHAPGAKAHPNLIPPTRTLLDATGKPWILENVEGARAHMPGAITLCGTSFGLRAQGHALHRHRLFIASFPLFAPPCQHADEPVIGIYGGHARRRSAKHGGRGTRDAWEGGHRAAASEAMGMDWATLAEMSEAIPPAFTDYLGRQLLAHLQAQRLAA